MTEAQAQMLDLYIQYGMIPTLIGIALWVSKIRSR